MKQLLAASLLVLMLFVAVACTSPSPTPSATPTRVESTSTVTTAAPVTQAPPAIQPVLTNTATLEPVPTPSAMPTSPPPTAQPTLCSPPPGWPAYTIQAGDTLFSIAYNTGTSVDQLKLANCLAGDTIYAGQTLLVPFIPYIPPSFPTLPSPARSGSNARNGVHHRATFSTRAKQSDSDRNTPIGSAWYYVCLSDRPF